MSDAPLPSPTPDSQPYWDGLRNGQLLLQRCGRCGTARHYPRPVCDRCFSMDVTWAPAVGEGQVHSWTVTHHPFLPSFRERLPYALVAADLPEGVRLLARLRGPADGLALGAPVRCGFEPLGDWVVPVWELA